MTDGVIPIIKVKWRNEQMPLRHWLENIRDFYHRSRPIQSTYPSI